MNVNQLNVAQTPLKYIAGLLCVLLPLLGKTQAPTQIDIISISSPTYIYVGSLTRSTTDAANCEKLKIDVFGGYWTSSTNGQTTFYIANRGGLSINEVTTGSASIKGYLTLHAYQNGNQTDFYLVAPASQYETWGITSYWLSSYFANSKFITPTTSTTAPTTTEITPLTITSVMTTDGAGNIGINTDPFSQYKLAVNGSTIATSMTVKLQSAWPDYVFKQEYQLPALSELKSYIDQYHHLPDMPSEREVSKDGINLGEMNKLLTKKVEELTLYLIEKDKKEQEQEKINREQIQLNQIQQEQISQLKRQLKSLAQSLNKK